MDIYHKINGVRFLLKKTDNQFILYFLNTFFKYTLRRNPE